MHLVYINPNATQAMTDSVVAVAKTAVPQAKITGLTNTDGPAAIEGPTDGEKAVPGVLNLVNKAQTMGADIIVIACFDDTALPQARAIATCPVLGIGQSAFTVASLIGGQFGIVTSVAQAVPVIKANLVASGFNDTCACVRASGLAVLDIEDGGEDMLEHLSGAIRDAKHDTNCRTIILGCAGMAMHHRTLSTRTDVVLVDGVAASAHLAVAAARVATQV
ncbi:MAG: aspartate/glutamate racemase family protein [Pelagimonas sp.]|uniref:aspartate/glutamate racemase family protein n=1 Tax=Pelagimonas sp. TaxID=2073170 RepID=UPI003D6B28F1